MTETSLASASLWLGWMCVVAAAPTAQGAMPRALGCCPGCMNGGAPGSDSELMFGATAADAGSISAPIPDAPRRDQSVDLYARPSGGLAAGPATSAPDSTGTSANAAPPPPATSVPTAALAADAPTAAVPSVGLDGVLALDFARLASFAYAPPRPGDAPMAGVPPTVCALDGRRVRVTGYMLPFVMEAGRCRQFLILRSQMACCYGTVPQPTEWVVATSVKGVPPVQDTPVGFSGTLRVGATFDHGVFTGVYSLEVDDEPKR